MFSKIYLEIVMKTFKEYINESPQQTGNHYIDDTLDNEQENKLGVQTIEATSSPVAMYKSLSIYSEESEKNKYVQQFVNPILKMVTCLYIFRIVDNNMIMLSVWNSKNTKGLAFDLLFNYYLPKYTSITSNHLHSTQGENFWKKIIRKGMSEGYRCTALTVNGEEDIILDTLNLYWDQPKSVLRIYAK